MRDVLREIGQSFAVGVVLALVVAGPAHAVDGVIEINQARALAGYFSTTGRDNEFQVPARRCLTTERCCIGYSIHGRGGRPMVVRLNITMDEVVYARLKKEVRPKKLSAFITEAVRTRLSPEARTLDAAYRAASKERWRRLLTDEWRQTETEAWPE